MIAAIHYFVGSYSNSWLPLFIFMRAHQDWEDWNMSSDIEKVIEEKLKNEFNPLHLVREVWITYVTRGEYGNSEIISETFLIKFRFVIHTRAFKFSNWGFRESKWWLKSRGMSGHVGNQGCFSSGLDILCEKSLVQMFFPWFEGFSSVLLPWQNPAVLDQPS